MLIAEIHENVSGLWTGQLVETDNGAAIGASWQAASRGALIATINNSMPFGELPYRDCLDPLDP